MKDRRFRTYPSRWGDGKVHRYAWDPWNRVWYVACRQPYNDPHGERVEDDAEVTCKKCLR